MRRLRTCTRTTTRPPAPKVGVGHAREQGEDDRGRARESLLGHQRRKWVSATRGSKVRTTTQFRTTTTPPARKVYDKHVRSKVRRYEIVGVIQWQRTADDLAE